MKVELHRAADAELQAAAIFYEDRVPGLGEQFLTEVEHACSRLGEHQLWDRDSIRNIGDLA